MAKVITVSRKYPSYHSKKGQPTYFVEKIYNSLGDIIPQRKCGFYYEQILSLNPNLTPTESLGFYDSVDSKIKDFKNHTIRKGKRWKTGDMASIRIWGNNINPKSGRSGAYHSKQIIISPDIKVTVFDIEIEVQKMKNVNKGQIYVFIKINGKHYWCNAEMPINDKFEIVAKNDGLLLPDLKEWFNYPKTFSGQIICWNKEIKY